MPLDARQRMAAEYLTGSYCSSLQHKMHKQTIPVICLVPKLQKTRRFLQLRGCQQQYDCGKELGNSLPNRQLSNPHEVVVTALGLLEELPIGKPRP